MKSYGSCNSVRFAVHEHSTGFHAVGSALAISGMAQPFSYKEQTDHIAQVRTKMGQQWGWEYLSDEPINPIVQICRNSSNGVVYAWEGEHYVDRSRPAYSALSSTNDTGATIIPSGGSIVSMVMPTLDEMEALETTVEAAALPAWATGIILERLTTAAKLKDYLWRRECSRAGLAIVSDITEAMNRLFTVQEYDLYSLLFLRLASRILYDHYGQTCIPLLLARVTVDSDGVPTVV